MWVRFWGGGHRRRLRGAIGSGCAQRGCCTRSRHADQYSIFSGSRIVMSKVVFGPSLFPLFPRQSGTPHTTRARRLKSNPKTTTHSVATTQDQLIDVFKSAGQVPSFLCASSLCMPSSLCHHSLLHVPHHPVSHLTVRPADRKVMAFASSWVRLMFLSRHASQSLRYLTYPRLITCPPRPRHRNFCGSKSEWDWHRRTSVANRPRRL